MHLYCHVVIGGVPAVGPALDEAGGAAEGALRREDQGREREEGGDATQPQ